MHKISKLFSTALLTCSIAITMTPVCHAEENDLGRAMEDYRKHDWDGALSHLGAALPNEFNNANLHYHMANCMVHMRQKESAIREYRIAYALDPQGKIGNYSKQCLHLFGIDAAGFLPMPEAPPKVDSRGKDVETLAKKESKDSKDSKDSKEPKDAKEQKDSKDSGLAKVAKFVTEEDRVRQNLQDLIQSKPRPGSAKLQEIGTNVFVRNYKDPSHSQTIATSEKSSAANNAQAKQSSNDKSGVSATTRPSEKSGTNSQVKLTKPDDKHASNTQAKSKMNDKSNNKK